MYRFRQSVEHAVISPSGTDRIHGDAACRQRDGEVAAEDLHRGFGCAHRHPGLPASEAAAGSVGDGDHASAFAHQWLGLAHCYQKGFSLRVDGRIELVERDLHWSLIEGGDLSARVAHKNIKRAELVFHLLENSADLVRIAHVSLHEKSV